MQGRALKGLLKLASGVFFLVLITPFKLHLEASNLQLATAMGCRILSMLQRYTEKDNPIGVVPSAPWRICSMEVLNDHCLSVQFVDGTKGLVDLSGLIYEKDPGVFAALKDGQFFKKAYIDRGAVTWPGDLDLASDAMYESIKKTGEYIL